MYFIGITGGIGAGKSEVLNYIRNHYRCEIYLADEVAHLIKEPGSPVYVELVKLLGQEIIGEDGSIDRGKMAEKIFAVPVLLEQVNQMIHPAVKNYLLEHLRCAEERGETELFFVEAALLIEGGYLELVDEMWYIYANETVRRKRLRESRGYSDEKVSRIFASQLTEERFRESCGLVIDNGGPFRETSRQIDRRLAELGCQPFDSNTDLI